MGDAARSGRIRIPPGVRDVAYSLRPRIASIQRGPILAGGSQRADDVRRGGSGPYRGGEFGYISAVGVLPDAAVERSARGERYGIGNLDAVRTHVRRRHRGYIE